MNAINGNVETDLWFFHEGTACRVYRLLGQHREGGDRIFRVFAPNADSVELVGSFGSWDHGYPLSRISLGGVWEIKIPVSDAPEGSLYKFRIIKEGRVFYKADPYGYMMESPPDTASVIYDLPKRKWHDSGWLKRRAFKMASPVSQPINIYELHTQSWKKHPDGSLLSWEELADDLSPYLKQMGYTHVELMPIMEHPYDGSWGYQISGYFAPTSRHGTPEDFMKFVDTLHTAGIGVILDWVPAHFPKDAHGLYEFDGQPLYEYQSPRKRENYSWGTRYFDLGRNEVESFLISNAVYWADVYHIDGLRVDAVASMLYLDFDRRGSEWEPNIYGGNQNLEAIAFLKKLNASMKRECPGVLMIAEESTAWSGITSDDGLGFDFKWNMGWMNDTLSYAETDPIYRCYHHDKLTFPLTYAFSEKYILPISHDENVHGKKSFLDKMPGDYWRKFAGVRAFAAWQMTHPGKKLTFMGMEIGQFAEWDHSGQTEWFLLEYDSHARLQLYFSDLNNFYLSHSELWELDGSWDGFEWLDPDDRSRSVISFVRKNSKGDELLALINFTPAAYDDFMLCVSSAGEYTEVFNSDDQRYGGSGVTNGGKTLQTTDGNALNFRVPPLGCVIFSRNSGKEKKTKLCKYISEKE